MKSGVEVVEEEEVIFNEIKGNNNEIIHKNTALLVPSKQPIKSETEGPQSAGRTVEKENWDELTEKIQTKRRELQKKPKRRDEQSQNNILIR